MTALANPVSGGRGEIVDRLLTAGGLLLMTKPPSAITGRQLAEAAGVNYGLLHRHIGSKTDALRMALDRIIESFLAEAFDPDTDLPRPNPLASQETYWRATTLVALDEAAFRAVHPQSPVLIRYRRGLAAARPDLDERSIDMLVTLSAALHFGLSPWYRQGMAAAFDLEPDDPRIDELLVEWVDGIHQGHGPLGRVLPPRILRWSEPEDEPVVKQRGDPAEQLIEAGAFLLRDRAASAITGRELAVAAGVNYGLIHHYFGSKDEVLREADDWHRRRFFELTYHDGHGADYFEVSLYPGFVRVVTWAAVDRTLQGTVPTAGVAGDTERPTIDHLLQRATNRGADLGKDQRIALMASVATQLAWVLIRPAVELEFGYPIEELTPRAAALLHELTRGES